MSEIRRVYSVTRDQLARAIAAFPDTNPGPGDSLDLDWKHEWWASSREFADGIFAALDTFTDLEDAFLNRTRETLQQAVPGAEVTVMLAELPEGVESFPGEPGYEP